MPEIPQHYRQQRLAPLSGVGNLSSSDIAAATQENRDAIKTGEAITEFGMAFMEQKEKAEFHNQLNTAKTEYLTKFFDYEQDLQTNADTETYIPNLKAGQTSSYKFTSKRAANEFELWKANEDLSQTRRVFGAKNDRDVQNYTDNWNLGIKEDTRRYVNAVSDADAQHANSDAMERFGLEYATDKDGKPVLDKDKNPTIQLKEDWENPLLDTDEVRMAGYKSWKADADAKRKVNIQEQTVSSLEQNMVAAAAKTNWDDAIALITDPANLQALTQVMGLDGAKKVLANMESFARSQKEVAKRKKEVTQTNTTKDFILQIADSRVPISEGDPEVPAPPAITELTSAFKADEITEAQYNGLVKRLTTKTVTDRVKEAELYAMSLGVGTTVTKTEYDKAVNASSNSLDDDSYRRLTTAGSDELEASQKEFLSTANSQAFRQLISTGSDIDFAEEIKRMTEFSLDSKGKIKERQQEFWNLSKYNAEMRDWIEKNPDKLGKERFQQAESLLVTYKNRSIEDIKALREARKAELKGTKPDETPAPDATPSVKAASAFDPEGKGYDDATFDAAGLKADGKSGHKFSFNPSNGLLLKGLNHKTFHLTVKEEERLGNKIIKKGGRYYSVPKETRTAAPILVFDKAAYGKLPKGAWYVDKNGNEGIKK